MKVRDYFVQGRREWVRLHEIGGKEHEVPCHHNLEQYLDEYIADAGIAGEQLLSRLISLLPVSNAGRVSNPKMYFYHVSKQATSVAISASKRAGGRTA